MYKKKIAVRAMTAIAAGALLASNVMVAGAAGRTADPVSTEQGQPAVEPENQTEAAVGGNDGADNSNISGGEEENTKPEGNENEGTTEGGSSEDGTEEGSTEGEGSVEAGDAAEGSGETTSENNEEVEDTKASEEEADGDQGEAGTEAQPEEAVPAADAAAAPVAGDAADVAAENRALIEIPSYVDVTFVDEGGAIVGTERCTVVLTGWNVIASQETAKIRKGIAKDYANEFDLDGKTYYGISQNDIVDVDFVKDSLIPLESYWTATVKVSAKEEVPPVPEKKTSANVTFEIADADKEYAKIADDGMLANQTIDTVAGRSATDPGVELSEGYQLEGWKVAGTETILDVQKNYSAEDLIQYANFDNGEVGQLTLIAEIKKTGEEKPVEQTSAKVTFEISEADAEHANFAEDAVTTGVADVTFGKSVAAPDVEVQSGYQSKGWAVKGSDKTLPKEESYAAATLVGLASFEEGASEGQLTLVAIIAEDEEQKPQEKEYTVEIYDSVTGDPLGSKTETFTEVTADTIQAVIDSVCPGYTYVDHKEVGETLMVVVKKQEGEKPAEKTVTIDYIDEASQEVIDTYIYHTTENVTSLAPEILAGGLIDQPDYELVDQENAMPLPEGVEVKLSVKVRKKTVTPAEKEIVINYIDEETQQSIGTITYHAPEGVKELSKEILEGGLAQYPGYELVDKESSVPVGEGEVKVKVRKMAETEVVINYIDEATEQSIGTITYHAFGTVDELSKEILEGGLKQYPGYELVDKTTESVPVGGNEVKVKVRKMAETEVVINYIDEATEQSIGTITYHASGTVDELSREILEGGLKQYPGYELVDKTTESVPVGDGELKVKVRKVAETEIVINYIDEATQQSIGKITYHATGDVTELSPEILAAGLKKDYPEYELVDQETSVPVGDSELQIKVRKKAVTPAEKEIVINYIDEATQQSIGKITYHTTEDVEELSPEILAAGLQKDYPEYELVDQETTVPVGDSELQIKVRKKQGPVVEQKDAVLVVSYMNGEQRISSETYKKPGDVGKSYTFTAADVTLKAPQGYELVTTEFTETSVAYGATYNYVVAVKQSENGNNGGGTTGGGSHSGGSSGGSGSRVGAAYGSSVLANGNWHQLDDQRWEYNFTDGTKARNGWYVLSWQDRDDWYYFDADGYLVSGWYTDANGVKYYLHAQHDGTFGRMYTGWNKVDGAWQHFNDNTEQGVYGAWEQGTPVPTELANL